MVPLRLAATLPAMLPLLAHLTPLEMPIVWIAFAAGTLLGATGAWLLLRRGSSARG